MQEERGEKRRGRALIDFFLQTAECCEQDRTPGESCPAPYMSPALTSQYVVDQIREHGERAKPLLLPRAPTPAPLRCRGWEEKCGSIVFFFPNKHLFGFLFSTKIEFWVCFSQLAEHYLTSCMLYTTVNNIRGLSNGTETELGGSTGLATMALKHQGKHKDFFSDTCAVLNEFPELACCF